MISKAWAAWSRYREGHTRRAESRTWQCPRVGDTRWLFEILFYVLALVRVIMKCITYDDQHVEEL